MNLHYDHFNEVPMDEWHWNDFTPKEMACRHCGEIIIVHRFMESLQALRTLLGVPLPVTSGTRCPEYDAQLGGKGVHPSGEAADIQIAGPIVNNIYDAMRDLGFTGIGVKQHGPWDKRFIHLDMIVSSLHPRPNQWSYT